MNSSANVHGAAGVAIYLVGLTLACVLGIAIYGPSYKTPARRRSDETLRDRRS